MPEKYTCTTPEFPGMPPSLKTRRSVRAQPPKRWTMQVSLPMVCEPATYNQGALVKMRGPEDVVAQCQGINLVGQEMFIVFDLNAKNNVIDKRVATVGILDASLVHPREVFRGAILNGAAAIVLCHNHPSGEPTPSAEDVRITRQLIEAGRIIDIRVLDHIIIGRNPPGSTAAGYCSMKEQGLCSFGSTP